MTESAGAGGDEPPRMDPIGSIATLLSGILLWGGVGWLLDRWVGITGVFLPAGMLLGFGLSVYIIWLRLRDV